MKDTEEGFRKIICIGCDAIFTAPLRGGAPARCPTCAEVRRGRRFVCAVCGQVKKAAMAGAIPRVCNDCLAPYHVDCIRCHKPFDLPAKTREPKFCDECRAAMIREYYAKQRSAISQIAGNKQSMGRPVLIPPPPIRRKPA
jgi:hypothetical protein